MTRFIASVRKLGIHRSIAAAPVGSGLSQLRTRSPHACFLSKPGVAQSQPGLFRVHFAMQLEGIGMMSNVERGLGARPVRLALYSTATTGGDGVGINAGDKVAKAKARLVKAERELDAAQEADPVDDQRVTKAELGVAMAELSVAKAEWKAAPDSKKVSAEIGVAKAELSVAKAEWKAAPDSKKVSAEIGVAKAELGIAEVKFQAALEIDKAVFLASVETARKAYEKALNATTATLLQGLKGADLVVDLVRKFLKGACNEGDNCACASPEGCSIRRNYSLDNNVIISLMLHSSTGPLFLDRQKQIDTLQKLFTTRLNLPNWTSDKGYNPLFVVSNAQGQGKSLFLAKSGEILTGPGGVLEGAAVLPFTYNSSMSQPVTGVGMQTAVMLRAIYGGLMSSRRVKGCRNGVTWMNFLSAFNEQNRSVTGELASLTMSDWLEAVRELMGLSRTASKSSQLLLLVDEVVKVQGEEASLNTKDVYLSKSNAVKIYTLLGQALETSQFNNVLISALSPNYAFQKLTGSQRELITEGLLMTLISTSMRGVEKQLLDIVLSKAHFTDKNMTSNRKKVFQIALSLSGGHPRSVERIIHKLADENKVSLLWDQKDWRTVFKTFCDELSASNIAPFRMPSNALLEEIATRRPVRSMRSDNVWADEDIEEPAMTVSGGVEHGYLHITPKHDSQAREIIVVDLLPPQMSRAVVQAPLDLYSRADWGKTWNTTTSNATRPTAFQFLCLLLHDFLSLSKDKFYFQASDGAELCAAWSVIRSIQEGEPSTVLGPCAAVYCSTKDVVLESHQIRTRSLDHKTTSKKSFEEETLEREKFAARVQELRVQGADHWTVLLPPLEWPHVDLYVIFPKTSMAGYSSNSVNQSHSAGVSVKSHAGKVNKQLKYQAKMAKIAKSSSGSANVQSDSYVVWLGYDLEEDKKLDPMIDFVVTPSKICDLIPLSVMSLCLLRVEGMVTGLESPDCNSKMIR